MSSALRWGWVVSTTPRPLYRRERPSTHRTGGWVGPRAGLDGCGKSRPPPGFDPRTIQPVASRYTDWAIPALELKKGWSKIPILHTPSWCALGQLYKRVPIFMWNNPRCLPYFRTPIFSANYVLINILTWYLRYLWLGCWLTLTFHDRVPVYVLIS